MRFPPMLWKMGEKIVNIKNISSFSGRFMYNGAIGITGLHMYSRQLPEFGGLIMKKLIAMLAALAMMTVLFAGCT